MLVLPCLAVILLGCDLGTGWLVDCWLITVCLPNNRWPQTDVGGQTPLVFASLGGQEEAVRQLLAAGADTAIGESGGYTPLHASAYQGRA